MKIKKILTILFVLGFWGSAIADFFADIGTHTYLGKIHTTAQRQLSQTDEGIREIKSSNRTAGVYINQSVLSQEINDVTNQLSKTTSVSRDCNWTLRRLMSDPTNPRNWKRAQWTMNRVERTFFPETKSTSKNSKKERARSRESRARVMQESSKSGLALATTRQATVGDTEKEIVKIGKRAAKSDNVRQDGVSRNQYLAVIAHGINQLVEGQAKQSEMIAAFLLNASDNKPIPKKNNQSPSNVSKEEYKELKVSKHINFMTLPNGKKGSDLLKGGF